MIKFRHSCFHHLRLAVVSSYVLYNPLFLFVWIYVHAMHVFLCVRIHDYTCRSVLLQSQWTLFESCVYPPISNRWIQVTQKYIVPKPAKILVLLKRISSDNPVFRDLLTSRLLVVLARSSNCQPCIYGRSVFNLQKPALPEHRESENEGDRRSWGNKASTFVCVFKCWENISECVFEHWKGWVGKSLQYAHKMHRDTLRLLVVVVL